MSSTAIQTTGATLAGPSSESPPAGAGDDSSTGGSGGRSLITIVVVVIVLVLVIIVVTVGGYARHRRRRTTSDSVQAPPDQDGEVKYEVYTNPMFEHNSSAENNVVAGPAKTATIDSAGYALPDPNQPVVYEMGKPLPRLPAPTAAVGLPVTGGGLKREGVTALPTTANRGSLDIDRKTAETFLAAARVPGGFLLRPRGGGRGDSAANEGAVRDHVVSWMRDGERSRLEAAGGIRHDVLRIDPSSGTWRHISGSEAATSTGAASLESAAVALLERFGVRNPQLLLALRISQSEDSAAVYEVVQRDPVYDYVSAEPQNNTAVPMHTVNGISVPVGPYSIYDGAAVLAAAGALAGDAALYSQVKVEHATYAVAAMDETPYRALFPNAHAEYGALSVGLGEGSAAANPRSVHGAGGSTPKEAAVTTESPGRHGPELAGHVLELESESVGSRITRA